MDLGHEKDWRELCPAAAIEKDPDKLMGLVDEVNKALGELRKKPEFAVKNKKIVVAIPHRPSTHPNYAGQQTCENGLSHPLRLMFKHETKVG